MPGQELIELLGEILYDASEDIGKSSLGIDPIEFGGAATDHESLPRTKPIRARSAEFVRQVDPTVLEKTSEAIQRLSM